MQLWLLYGRGTRFVLFIMIMLQWIVGLTLLVIYLYSSLLGKIDGLVFT